MSNSKLKPVAKIVNRIRAGFKLFVILGDDVVKNEAWLESPAGKLQRIRREYIHRALDERLLAIADLRDGVVYYRSGE